MSRGKQALEQVLLASPRGPCAGVHRAIEVAMLALRRFGPPIFVNHDLVHNRFVVQELAEKGIQIEREPERVPRGSVYLLSAHGVSPDLRTRAMQRGLRIIDATCPLVTKVHVEAKKFDTDCDHLIFIGHKGHPEARGTMGVAPMHLLETAAQARALRAEDFPGRVAVLTQTTLSVEETSDIIGILKATFGENLQLPPGKDVCYATTNRQRAVRHLAPRCNAFVVIGSQHSSNSNRLREAAEQEGVPAILVDDFSEMAADFLVNVRVLGISSGASVPERFVEHFLDELLHHFPNANISTPPDQQGPEQVHFPLPSTVL